MDYSTAGQAAADSVKDFVTTICSEACAEVSKGEKTSAGSRTCYFQSKVKHIA